MQNHEIINEQLLLDKHGQIVEAGWARKSLQIYRRQDIKAPKFRIKEWDYYFIMAKEFAMIAVISDLGYIGIQSITFIDFKKKKGYTKSITNLLPMGKMNLPEQIEQGVSEYKNEGVYIRFVSKNGKRHLVGSFQKFDEKKTLNFDIRLEQPHKEHFVLAMPWEQKHHFYYNQKINCMPAKGWVKYNGTKYTFEPETDFAMLNWGRGVWPYENEWVWGVGNGYVNEKPFGFQIEYGFGDTKSASGNMIFYDGKIHKLEDVTCKIAINSDGNFWKITSSDKRFEMNFRPFMDYAKDTNYKVLINQQHQIFGYMNGIAVLDDGTRLEVKDFLCFIEKGKNKY